MTFDRPSDPSQDPLQPDDSELPDTTSEAPPPPPADPWPAEEASEPMEPMEPMEPASQAPPPTPPPADAWPAEDAPAAPAPTTDEPVEVAPAPMPPPQPVVEAEPEPAPIPAAPPPPPPPPPAQPAASQVNVNAAPVAAAPVVVDRGPGALYWARRVLSLLFAVLFVLIGIRIFLLLLVADSSNDIVNFVYSVTEPFVAPFRGMFQFDEVTAGARTLDVAALAALIGWLLIYVLIMAILRLADRDRG